MIAFDASHTNAALPPPLLSAEARLRAKADAGEGWGEGVSAVENPPEEKALTRAVGATSPASGRGEANFQLVMKHRE